MTPPSAGRLRKALVLALALLLPGITGAGVPTARVIALEHRSAEEILPLIKPLLGPRDVVTGSGFQLIVRARTQTLAEIRQVVADLDTPPRNLYISVRRGEAGHGSDTARITRRTTTDRGGDYQTLRVLEGHVAFIRSGESIPVGSQRLISMPGGLALEQTVEYRDLGRGFLVRPRLLSAGRVHLDIRTVFERQSPTGGGRLDLQAVDSTLSGPVGEWISLTHTGTSGREDAARITGTRRQQDWQDMPLFVRVDVIHD
ncbi:hypothetical protein [Ectothiorhodospira lacustris]|uniref:hypothetical protein n=1 Tax=Ectothiorhodospira lacustris TaxID=2899127 RepID=UPI001EE80B25|nr:hypothetical protein [Ectothiorhodospira lacustris]MCG5500018.1 hypothetical protein [Ectothiorhodospira lacustris]MCG5510062.1 hypothetical protein [Ectothiorhodospira lacustris]MCG5521808.1 hypothetical protein [Ectothiorhodospira lacustris]